MLVVGISLELRLMKTMSPVVTPFPKVGALLGRGRVPAGSGNTLCARSEFTPRLGPATEQQIEEPESIVMLGDVHYRGVESLCIGEAA
jgi:hypothetical protein